jgi:2-amino-4-hydroxy-6-hydroxymethyldihydropteridine diphosphokinase
MNDAYLLLGSNEGDREVWLQQAMEMIQQRCGKVVTSSALYRTAAWGKEDQPDFLNMVAHIKTRKTSLDLLHSTNEIENLLGRQRKVKWGQRTLDIDILLYSNDIVNLPELKIPHPFMQNRRFTLVPLNEIAPNIIHPKLNKTIHQLLLDCPDPLEVHKFK